MRRASGEGDDFYRGGGGGWQRRRAWSWRLDREVRGGRGGLIRARDGGRGAASEAVRSAHTDERPRQLVGSGSGGGPWCGALSGTRRGGRGDKAALAAKGGGGFRVRASLAAHAWDADAATLAEVGHGRRRRRDRHVARGASCTGESKVGDGVELGWAEKARGGEGF